MQEPDPELLRRARERDLQAFEALARAYQGDMWRFARSMVRTADLADEVAQEALIRAYRFLPSFRGDSKFSSWLFRIVRNCAVDVGRRAARPPAALPVAPAPDHVARAEIRAALATIPARLREPFLLVEVFGLSYADAAVVLQTKEGTVKSRVHRARAALVAALSEEDAGEV